MTVDDQRDAPELDEGSWVYLSTGSRAEPAEAALLPAGVGEYAPSDLGLEDEGPILLTVSLGEPHDGWHTKLAAAVTFPPAVQSCAQAFEQRAW
jgi:hypothetical protein